MGKELTFDCRDRYLWNETEQRPSLVVIEQVPEEFVSQLLLTGAVVWQ